jgi:hypothetical protein
MKKQPDYFISLNVEKVLLPKCRVIYFPLNVPQNLIDSILIETKLNQMVEYLDHESCLSIEKMRFLETLEKINI